jgi:hypothetical protein
MISLTGQLVHLSRIGVSKSGRLVVPTTFNVSESSYAMPSTMSFQLSVCRSYGKVVMLKPCPRSVVVSGIARFTFGIFGIIIDLIVSKH